jgi:hypothetical protein
VNFVFAGSVSDLRANPYNVLNVGVSIFKTKLGLAQAGTKKGLNEQYLSIATRAGGGWKISETLKPNGPSKAINVTASVSEGSPNYNESTVSVSFPTHGAIAQPFWWSGDASTTQLMNPPQVVTSFSSCPSQNSSIQKFPSTSTVPTAPTTTTTMSADPGASSGGSALNGGIQPGPPPGAGSPWIPGTGGLVGAINKAFAISPFGQAAPIPNGWSVWQSEDPNNPDWFFVNVLAPVGTSGSNPNVGPADQGDGIAEMSPDGSWTLVSPIVDQAAGCFGMDGSSNTQVPASVLSDFGLSC